MFVLLQRIWVFLIVDGFLLFTIVQIARQKQEEKKRQTVRPKTEVRRQRGEKLQYHFCDPGGEDQSGRISQYPCLLGRGKHCDIVISEKAKQGRYYLSREFIQITDLVDGFRVTRCSRPEKEQETLSGIADGRAFADEISVKFEEKIEIRVTKQSTLCLERKILRTSAV